MVTKKYKQDCRINGQRCPECEYVHGREAEELRRAIEKLIAEYQDENELLNPRIVADRLQNRLDSIDARDALAYLNASGKRSHRRSA